MLYKGLGSLFSLAFRQGSIQQNIWLQQTTHVALPWLIPLLFERDWLVSTKQNGGRVKWDSNWISSLFLPSCDVTAWDSRRIMVHAGKIPQHSDFKQHAPGVGKFFRYSPQNGIHFCTAQCPIVTVIQDQVNLWLSCYSLGWRTWACLLNGHKFSEM